MSTYGVHSKNTRNTKKTMVYDTKTLEPCHALTKQGENEYRLMLELKADEILFRAKHPIKYWWHRISNLVHTGDSAWDGARYPE